MENKKPPPAGIEPATFRLTAERSNHWAKEASVLCWALAHEAYQILTSKMLTTHLCTKYQSEVAE